MAEVAAHVFGTDLSKGKDHYQRYARHGARILYALVLVAVAVFNLLIFVALVPLLAFLPARMLFVIAGVAGLLFGMIVNFLVRDIEHLEPRHHVLAAVLVPMLAVIDIAILVSLEQFLNESYLTASHDIVLASAVYVAMFALPYLADLALERLKVTRPRQRQHTA